MKKCKSAIALFLTGILSFSLFTACSKNQETALVPVRLNEVVHSVFYAPQYVAQELGFFEEQGLDVSVSIGQGADKSMTALLSDSADIALLGTEAGIYVYNEGKEDYPLAFAQVNCLYYINIDKIYRMELVKDQNIFLVNTFIDNKEFNYIILLKIVGD